MPHDHRVGHLPIGRLNLGLLLRMLVCRLAVTVRILAMRLGRAGVHFGLVVFTRLVVLGGFAVLMCRHLVLGSRSLVMCARRMFCGCRHQKISFKKNIPDVSGRDARLTPSRTTRIVSLQEGGVREAPPSIKKADVIERPKAFQHVGLLFNEPPGAAGLLFI